MKTQHRKILCFVFAVWCLLAIPSAYALLLQLQIANTGNIKTVGISADTANLEWGELTVGESKQRQVVVTNEGNQPCTLLVTTANWNPTIAQDYLDLTWDYTAEIIQPQASRTITFTLAVAQNIHDVASFSFDTFIEAKQA